MKLYHINYFLKNWQGCSARGRQIWQPIQLEIIKQFWILNRTHEEYQKPSYDT